MAAKEMFWQFMRVLQQSDIRCDISMLFIAGDGVRKQYCASSQLNHDHHSNPEWSLSFPRVDAARQLCNPSWKQSCAYCTMEIPSITKEAPRISH